MRSEILDVVNAKNKVIGQEYRNIIFEKGLWHRSTHVLIINHEGRFFAAKRSPDKKVHANLWGAMGEHPKSGESYIMAAKRGMKEELKVNVVIDQFELIKKPKYKFIIKNLLVNEMVNLYLIRSSAPYKISKEHTKHGYFSEHQLRRMNLTPPNKFAHKFYNDYRKEQKGLFSRFEKSKDSLWILWENKIIHKSKDKGIKPIVRLLKQKSEPLKYKIIFDKVMGRAAALLLVYGRVGEVHALVGSREAEKVFKKYKVYYQFKKRVNYIKGEKGRKVCPFEKLARGKNPESFYKLAKNKI